MSRIIGFYFRLGVLMGGSTLKSCLMTPAAGSSTGQIRYVAGGSKVKLLFFTVITHKTVIYGSLNMRLPFPYDSLSTAPTFNMKGCLIGCSSVVFLCGPKSSTSSAATSDADLWVGARLYCSLSSDPPRSSLLSFLLNGKYGQ